MINHIDLSSVLRRSVHALYSNLVTRPTGVAVRSEIEQLVAEHSGRTLTVIDFTHVRLLDFSCADEVVAKLLLRVDGYFIFRGLHESHLDAIEATLARYDLAMVIEQADGSARLFGFVADDEHRAWSAVHQLGGADVPTLAATIGAPPTDAARWLDALSARRLLMQLGPVYLPVASLHDNRL